MNSIAKAHTNIALIKYFGKCDEDLNLPAAPSLSLTLEQLFTQTQVEFDPTLKEDELWLNGTLTLGKALHRVSAHLDRMTKQDKSRLRAKVTSTNNFPTASGLASSASGFAALTLATYDALQKSIEWKDLSIMARQGSGSAARSCFGGLVGLTAGTPGQTDSSFAYPILSENDWPALRLVIGVVSEEEKTISSTDAMKLTAKTSPYYDAFLIETQKDISKSLSAISQKDIEQLGDITEQNALRMHASAMAAHPGIVFFQGPTLAAFHAIRKLRKQGKNAWFTCDAGPHPKVLTLESDAAFVASTLRSISGIQRVLISAPGPNASLLAQEISL